jgi:hypothetical protein
MSGELETDETFIRGNALNIHPASSFLRGILYNDEALLRRRSLLSRKAEPRRKPEPRLQVPGTTAGDRLSNALRRLLTISKKDLVEEEARINKLQMGVFRYGTKPVDVRFG